MASNLETLKAEGCIAPDANLSSAELKVIAELTPAEVKTLVGIRKKLAAASGGDEMTAASLSDGGGVTANIIV